MTRLTALRTQRVPFAPGGPVHPVRRGDRITLVGLGEDNVDTRWVDLGADGSFGEVLALPFAVESAAPHGDLLVLCGNELGSDAAVVLTVDGAGTVTGRDVVEGGTITRWPIPISTADGLALVWESTAGLQWSGAGESALRIADPGETNVLAVAATERGEGVMIARSKLDGSAEVLVPPGGSWRPLDIEGWVETVEVASWINGCVVAATCRGDRTLAIVVVDPGVAAGVATSIHAPGAGPLLSSTVRTCAVGERLAVSWSGTSRVRKAGGQTGTVDHQAVTVLDADLGSADDLDWLPLDPAGALHHSIIAAGDGRIVVVHGADDAFVTEFVVEHV